MKNFKLENEPKITTGFTTPENYFDEFSAKIKLKSQKEKPKVILPFFRKKVWMYAAASAVVLALTVPFYNYFNTQSLEIDDVTLENYISYLSTVSDEDLVTIFDESDIQKMKVNFDIGDETIENELSSNTNLEQYLINGI